MKKNLLFSSLTILIIWLSCNTETSTTLKDHWQNDRPYDPWVFRSVLDTQARMLTLALHENLWVAYDTERASLYKAWKGNVDFDGAVYTTAHGPQPISLGDNWILNEYSEPWSILVGGKEIKPRVVYKGHQLKGDKVELNYELLGEQGLRIQVAEQPEYAKTEAGTTSFERVFTLKGVPDGAKVLLKTNVNSVAMKERIETDGDFQSEKTSPRQYGTLTGIDVQGTLSLNSNAATTFTTHFTKKPLLENLNKSASSVEEDEERPRGYYLIGRNDCKTCHNTYRKTIGPSYVDIAKRYRNTPENVSTLIGKVVSGGAGNWGEAVMSAHPNVSEVDVKDMVDYIMTLDAGEDTENEVIEIADENLDYVFGQKDISENSLRPGVIVKIYGYDRNKELNRLADIDTRGKPTYSGILSTIRLGNSDFLPLQDNFAVTFDGYLKIEEAGKYKFRLNSDDGSRLMLGDREVINHDGLHGADAKDGSIALEKGYHPFRIDYFEKGGGESIHFQWIPLGKMSYETVSGTKIVHQQNDEPKDSNLPMASTRRIPGDGYILEEVHPSYLLSQARPNEFTPKVGGMDFLSDGRMVLSTWDPAGSVFIIDGVETGDPAKMSVKTIAKGLAEPLGLKVVDDEIYVLQKQELTKLIDHNGDEIIDEYYTLCNDWQVSANFHEFAFGLAYKEGYFYATLATAINPGGASTQPQIPDRGKAIKISKADGSREFIAHGLRTPNGVGLGVDNEVFVADNQGDWLPASKIVHIKKDAWYGSRSVDFEGTKDLKETLPVVWLPQDEVGNSPSTPLALNHGRYKGQMIHSEVTNGGVKRVFVEKVDGQYQGCLFRFIQGLEAGINRMCYGPDGALYVGGIGNGGNWQQEEKLWYGLQRLEYTNAPAFEMLAVRAHSNGMEIEFTEALQEGDGWNAKDYNVEQWRYEPTEYYGGPKLDQEKLTIKNISISDDRKKVFLEMDGIKAGHVVYVNLTNHWISEPGNQLWSTEAWYTLNRIPQNKPGFVNNKNKVERVVNELTPAEKAAGWKLLFDGKTTKGWRNFRKETIGSSWKVVDGSLMLETVQKEDGSYHSLDGGDIITEGEYENFELQLEWKISNCGNSGIMYNVIESEDYHSVWLTGPEMQVLDNTCHPDAVYQTHRAGDLYDMIECKYLTVNPAGQWNKIRIIINNGKLEHWLNGHLVVETEMWTDEWNEMVANSKFRDMPDFGKSHKGHISLQDHRDQVWYRNIKIKELTPES